MQFFWITLLVLAAAAILFLGVMLVCFFMAFYMTDREKHPKEEYSLPPGEIYKPHREQMVAWMRQTRAMPHKTYTLTSFDGLRLQGKFYEYAPGAPIELMFHGYRGLAERDLCGGVQRCFSLGYSVFIVDQRACGNSDGRVVSFGINESKDAAAWVDLLVREFGPQTKIILTGISMGASTVLMAAGRPLPPNVVAVVADCGYTSPKEIICKVIHQMHLPARLLYPFVRWSGKLFGGFDVEEYSPLQAMEACRLPIIFFHGERDDYVPCDMSRDLHAACKAPKALLTVPGAGHGLCYIIDREGYVSTLQKFAKENGLPIGNP